MGRSPVLDRHNSGLVPGFLRVGHMDIAIGQQGQAGTIRREELFGRQHWVVPAVAVQEQVLENNVGSMFLPAEEIKASVNQWDFTPVTAGHPKRAGRPTSARDPDVVNSRAIGIVFNSRFEDGALKVDVFIDPDQAENVAGGEELLAQLQRGEIGEVSTGFAFRAESRSGEFGGDEFDLIARNIRPDHLAVGIEQGACSVEDGCGLGVNIRDTARTPTFEGTTSSEWNAPTLDDFTAALDIEADTVEKMNDEDKSRVAGHTLLGESDAETFEDLSFFPVVEPETGNLNENALRAVISGRGEQADITADAKERAQDTARELLKEEFDMDADAENVADTVVTRIKSWFESEVQPEEGAMSEDQITELSEATGLSEEHLEGMEEDRRETLATNILSEEESEEENTDETATNEAPEDAPEWAANLIDEVTSLREDVDEVREAAEPAVNEYREEQGKLVSRLASNDRCPFGEDELEGKGLDELRKLDQMAKNRDYGGRGAPRATEVGDNVDLGFDVGSPWKQPAEA